MLARSIADEQGPKLWSQSWASIQHYDPGQVTTSLSRSFLGSKIGLERLPQLLGGENFAPRAAEICGSDAGGSLEHCEPSPQQDNKMPSPSWSPEIWNVPGMLQAATELQCVDSRAVWGPRPGGSPQLPGAAPSLGVRCSIGPGRAHQGPRPGWAVSGGGWEQTGRGITPSSKSTARQVTGPAVKAPRPPSLALSPSSSFSCHRARHTASHSQAEVASFPATPLSRHPWRLDFSP